METSTAANVITAVCAALTLAITIGIAQSVRAFTKKREQLEFTLRKWELQQQVNLAKASNDSLGHAFEELVYKSEEAKEVTQIPQWQRYYLLFMTLNRVQHDWWSMKKGFLSKGEFEEESRDALALIIRQRRTIGYLLHRGYNRDFRQAVERILDDSDHALDGSERKISPFQREVDWREDNGGRRTNDG
jgi:hypothetical protein